MIPDVLEGMIYGALFVAAWAAVALLHAYPLSRGFRGWMDCMRHHLLLRRIRRTGRRVSRAFNDLAVAADECSTAMRRLWESWPDA